MKFKINIQSKEVLLTYEQLDTLVGILHGIDVMANEYVGGGKGDEGTNYLMSVRKLNTADMVFSAVHDDFVEAVRLKTKLHDESKNQ